MRKIKLTANDGEELLGKLPDNWQEVPLGPYTELISAADVPARIEATAALVGLPAEPLLNDVSLFAAIVQAAPWLFNSLPPAGEPVTEFSHAGLRYRSTGRLAKLTAGQLEAVYTMQQAYSSEPVKAAPGVLAVLFCPEGKVLTPELHQAGTAAFATLPMAVAWPAFVDFNRNSGPRSASILFASALSAQLHEALTNLETTLATAGAGPTCWQKLLRWLTRRWLTNARKTVSMS